MGSSTAAEYNKALQRNLSLPFVIYGLLFGYYAAMKSGKFTWFSWHPIASMMAFVVLAGNSILLKKVGGYENTKLHGILYAAAVAIGIFGGYVIYSNKEQYNKPHLVTGHGKFGAFVLLSYIGMTLGGLVGLHPDFGIMRTDKTFRAVHKYAGRVLTALSWVVCFTGFAQMHEGNIIIQLCFGLPLFIAGFLVLV